MAIHPDPAAALLAGLALLAPSSPAPPRPPAAPSPLVLAAVVVAPPAPGPATLCRLRVRVENRGERAVTAFSFAVAVDGRELPAAARRLDLTPVLPGETATLRLPGFWTSEGGRPAPAGDRLTVEVRLTSARWAALAREGETPVWTLLGEVPGLPIARRLTLELRPAGAAGPS